MVSVHFLRRRAMRIAKAAKDRGNYSIRLLRAQKVLLQVSTYDLSKERTRFRCQSQRGANLRVFRLDESRQL